LVPTREELEVQEEFSRELMAFIEELKEGVREGKVRHVDVEMVLRGWAVGLLRLGRRLRLLRRGSGQLGGLSSCYES
jgi:hypothetical protein